MKEYIERAELYEAMNSQDCEFSLIDALALIEEFPAADVVEARHGKWINVCGYDMAECSECKAVFDVADQYTSPTKQDFEEFCKIHRFCPACGAKMDGKEDA